MSYNTNNIYQRTGASALSLGNIPLQFNSLSGLNPRWARRPALDYTSNYTFQDWLNKDRQGYDFNDYTTWGNFNNYNYQPATQNFKAPSLGEMAKGILGTTNSLGPKTPNTSEGLFGKYTKGDMVRGAIGQGVGILGKFINKGASNDVGNTLDTLGNVAMAIPGWGTIAGVALKGLGVVANGFTDKVNRGHQRAVNSQINQIAGTTSNAANYNDLIADRKNWTTANIGKLSDWGSIGFLSSGKNVKGARNNAIAAAKTAYGMRANNESAAANNINVNNALKQAGTLSAYGGPIFTLDPMSAVGQQMFTDSIMKDDNKDKKNNNMNPYYIYPNQFDQGGNLFTNGGNFYNGLTKIGVGGTHEENPNEGVQVGVDGQGTPNLVEEDELVWDNGYVFSNRLRVPRIKRGAYGKRNKYAKGGKLNKGKKAADNLSYEDKVLKPYQGLTFAEAAEKAEKLMGADERMNDPIALRGLGRFDENNMFDTGGPLGILNVLMQAQEKEREKEKLAQMQKAIDNMSPEEFAAMQQQQQAQQQEQQMQEQQMQEQQAAAAQEEAMQAQAMQEGAAPPDITDQIAQMQQSGYALGGTLDSNEGNLYYDGSTLLKIPGYTQEDLQNFVDFWRQNISDSENFDDSLDYRKIWDVVSAGSPKAQSKKFDSKEQTLQYLASMYKQHPEVFNRVNFSKYNFTTPEPSQSASYSSSQPQDSFTGIPSNYIAALRRYNLTADDYAEYQRSQKGDIGTFDPKTAKQFINKADKAQKKFIRKAKRMGIRGEELNGAALQQYNSDMSKSVRNSVLSDDYDISKDSSLALNSNYVSSSRNKDKAYFEAARDFQLSQVYPERELDDKGRVKWDSALGLQAVTGNDANNFYTDFSQLDQSALPDALSNNRGIYNYTSRSPHSLDLSDGVKLYNWAKQDDGTYAVNLNDPSPNATSLRAGNSPQTYPPSNIGDLDYGDEGYAEALKAIQDTQEYKNQTQEVLDAMAAIRKGEASPKVKERMMRYFKYLDDKSNTTDKLLNGDNLVDDAETLYDRRRKDNLHGIYHYQYDKGKGATADRYFYTDPVTGEKIYVFRPKDGLGFNVSTSPLQASLGDITYNDYEITGFNKNRTLTQTPTGRVFDLTDSPDLSEWKALENAPLQDSTLPLGITGTSKWVDYAGSPADKKVGKYEDKAPMPSNLPYWLAGGLSLASLGHNIFSPIDYSNADAMLKAGQDAGKFTPIGAMFAGQQLPYKPAPNTLFNELAGANQATARNIINNSNGNIGALTGSLIGNNQAGQAAQSKADEAWRQGNWSQLKDVQTLGLQRDTGNYDRLLKADEANLQAESRAKGFQLEANKNAYATRQALQDARNNDISLGIKNLGDLALAIGTNDWQRKLAIYGINKGGYGHQYYDTGKQRSKGGTLKKRRNTRGF